TVRVTDANRTPVASASIGILEMTTLLASAETDARGVATVRLPADAQVWDVIALKPGVGFDYFENYRAWPPGETVPPPPAEVALLLDGAQTLRIRATASAGKPLSGIEFLPWTLRKPGKLHSVNLSGTVLKHAPARTDAQGIAVFTWIPREVQEGVSFLERSPGFHLPQFAH